MGLLENFLARLKFEGIEPFGRFYGVYRAEVTRVDDPQRRGRVQALCAEAGHSAAPDVWIDPVFDGAGANRGSFWPPEIGDSVRIGFYRGDVAQPHVYWGGWFGTKDLPAELGYPAGDKKPPMRRGFVLRQGHQFTFDEESGKESINLVWRKPRAPNADPKASADRGNADTAHLKFTKDGAVLIQNKQGTELRIDADGVTITTGQKVVIEGGSEFTANTGTVSLGSGAGSSAVKGEDLKALLGDLIDAVTRIVVTTGVGPSVPPVVNIAEFLALKARLSLFLSGSVKLS